MNNELKHYGVIGMKWGVRRYQNPDGSLTAAGKKKYLVNDGRETAERMGMKTTSNSASKRTSKQVNDVDKNKLKEAWKALSEAEDNISRVMQAERDKHEPELQKLYDQWNSMTDYNKAERFYETKLAPFEDYIEDEARKAAVAAQKQSELARNNYNLVANNYVKNISGIDLDKVDRRSDEYNKGYSYIEKVLEEEVKKQRSTRK